MTQAAKFTIFLLMIFYLDGDGKATGYSSCTVKMIPVAIGANGTILFRTSFRINTMGGQYHEPLEIGWLVVSSRGVWDYARHVYLTFDDGTFVSPADSVHLRKFESAFRFGEEDEVLASLIRKHQIHTLIGKNVGRGSVSWTKYGVYKSGARISRNNEVKSIFGIKNESGKGNPVRAAFYYEGIALVHSEKTLNEQEDDYVVTGAQFFDGSNYQGTELWLDLYSIDGLVILNQ